MSDLLNTAQRNSLAIGLRTFEMHLRQADAWLQSDDERGILYRRGLRLSVEQRSAARNQIATALAGIASLAQRFGLTVAEEDLRTTIASQMGVDWANLCDLTAAKLRRYGAVQPGLADLLDADLAALAQQALALAALGQDRGAP